MCWIVLRWDDFSMCFCICKTRWILVKDQRLDEFSFFVPSVSILRGEILEQIVNLNWSDKSFSGCNGSQGDAFTKAPSDDFEIWGWDYQDCNIVSFSILRLFRLHICLILNIEIVQIAILSWFIFRWFANYPVKTADCTECYCENIILYSIPSQRLLTTLILTEVAD